VPKFVVRGHIAAKTPPGRISHAALGQGVCAITAAQPCAHAAPALTAAPLRCNAESFSARLSSAHRRADAHPTVPRRELSRLSRPVHTVRQDAACACVARLGDPSALRFAYLAAARSCPRLAPSSRHLAPVSPRLSKSKLRVGAARWLCSGYRPAGSVWLGGYDRGLLTPARCADVPPPESEAGQPARGERANTLESAPLAGSDDTVGGRAASRRCHGFAQSCGWRWSFDRGRSDPCSRHQQGSCGRYACVSVRELPQKGLRPGGDRPLSQLQKNQSSPVVLRENTTIMY
jgi:hypothetical protein